MKCLVYIVFVFISSMTAFGQLLSTGIVIADSIDYPHAVYTHDIDGDSDADILYLGWTEGEVSWLENLGDNSFVRHVIETGFSGARYAQIIDLDSDGDSDVVGVARNLDQTVWWENNGSQIFTKHIIDGNRVGPATVSVADMDNDNDDDIVVGCWKTPDIYWYENDGRQSFIKHTLSSNVLTLVSYVEICDINVDGLPDVIAISCYEGELVWFENLGNAVFDIHVLESNLECGHTVRSADVDQDGDPDLLAAYYTQNRFVWWENVGSGNFERHLLGNVSGKAIFIESVDFDDDGDKDILGCVEFGHNIYFYENNGEQNFSPHVIDNDYTGLTSIDFVDLDGDYDPEIIGAGCTKNAIVIWENLVYSCDFGYSVHSGHAPLTVSFYDSTNSHSPIDQWAWDFDNNGTVDCHNQDPVWQYTQPGDYSVNLTATINSTTLNCFKSSVIHVFDGESSLLFNGEDGSVVCPATPEMNLDSNFTLEAWIKPKGWGDGGTTGYGRIIDKNTIRFMIIGPGNGNLNDNCLMIQLQAVDESYSFITTPVNSISLDEWQHTACVYASGEISLYINGVKQQLTSSTEVIPAIGDNSENDLIIGNDSYGYYTFDGMIDEVRVWNIERTGEDLIENNSIYLAGSETGLVGYWRMNEGSGTAVIDCSLNDNDGIGTGIDWYQGALEYFSSIEEQIAPTVVKDFILDSPFPNPFNNQVQFRWKIFSESLVKISIYDLYGCHIKDILNDVYSPGDYSSTWNGRNFADLKVSTGIYILQLTNGKRAASRKIVLLK